MKKLTLNNKNLEIVDNELCNFCGEKSKTYSKEKPLKDYRDLNDETPPNINPSDIPF